MKLSVIGEGSAFGARVGLSHRFLRIFHTRRANESFQTAGARASGRTSWELDVEV